MSYADQDKRILADLQSAMKKWWDIFFSDPITTGLNVKHQIVNDDMPELRRIRWYATADELAAEKLWLRYVDNAEMEASEFKNSVFDFYMSGATYIWLNTPVASAHYDQFIEHLATSLTWGARCNFIPKETREYLASVEDMRKFLKGNNWAIFLILLSMSDLQ